MHLPKKEKPEYTPRENQQGSVFLKFKDGDVIFGLVRGEAYEFYTRWVEGKSENFTSFVSGAKNRYRLNIAVKEGDSFVAKIWEFGQVVYDQLAEINEDYPIDKGMIKIKRQGLKLDTTYVVLPAMNQKISLSEQKEIDGLKLNILNIKEVKTKTLSPPVKNHAPQTEDEELPF